MLLLTGQVLVEEEKRAEAIRLFVNCNDTFGYACADVQPLLFDDIIPLYVQHTADPLWGILRWCCLKRQMRPLREIELSMRLSNGWDDALEKLPERA